MHFAVLSEQVYPLRVNIFVGVRGLVETEEVGDRVRVLDPLYVGHFLKTEHI